MSDIRTLSQLQQDVEILKASETPGYISSTWGPSFTGFSANPAGGTYSYILIGKLAYILGYMPNLGTTNAANPTMTAPFTNGGAEVRVAMGTTFDNSVRTTTPGVAQLPNGTNVITFGKDMAGAAFTNPGGMRVIFEMFFQIA